VPQNGGNVFLQGLHCRVFAPMVVPDLRVINGAPHSLIGLGHGVTAQIDRKGDHFATLPVHDITGLSPV
jgi:hypothetical protein